MSGELFKENAWGLERSTHNMGVGEGGPTPLLIPPDCTIVLARIQDSEFFHVIVDGEPLPEIMHKNDDFFRKIGEWLHIRKIRAEVDDHTGGGII